MYANVARVYDKQKRYDLSLPLNLKCLQFHKQVNNTKYIGISYYNLSETYLAKKNYEKALSYIDSSLNIMLTQKLRPYISEAYKTKSVICKNLNYYEEAYNAHKLHKQYSDSIFNNEKTQKIQALKSEYTFNKEIESLELKNKHEAKQKKIYVLLFLITFVCGCLISLLILKNYRQKIKISKIQFEKEQKALNSSLKEQEKKKYIKHLIADNSMRVTFKEELINHIKYSVKEKRPDQLKSTLLSLIAQLQLQINTEKKLDGIHEKIHEINSDFEQSLKNKFPQLTRRELDLCSLLRLNLSIKETMTIRNVSVDSVKSMRRRIRKKNEYSFRC